MADRDAFLRAIADHPDDDGPRLVYADWLDEHGDAARAEFLRVQCAASALPVFDDRRTELEDRADDLLAAHEADWLGPLGPILSDWEFRRGLLERVEMVPRHFVRHADQLFGPGPAATVCFAAPGRGLAAALGHEASGRLVGLDLRHHASVETWLRVVASRRLGSLRRLNLAGGPATPIRDLSLVSVALLARSPMLGRLTDLHMGHAYIGRAGLKAFRAEPVFAGLRELDLRDNHLTEGSMALLADRPAFATLERLSWASNRLDADDRRLLEHDDFLPQLRELTLDGCIGVIVDRLAAAPRFRHLTALSLVGTSQGDGPAYALAAAKWPLELRALRLGYNRFSPASLSTLASAKTLDWLRVLDLEGCEIGPAGLGALLPREGTLELRALVLGANPLEDDGALLLADWPGLARLRALDLARVGLTPAGLAALLANMAPGGLRCLRLAHNSLGDAGLHLLANSPALVDLTELDVSHTDFTAAGLAVLLNSAPLERLTVLRIGGIGLPREVFEVLAACRGLPRLRWLDLGDTHVSPESGRRLRDRWGRRARFRAVAG